MTPSLPLTTLARYTTPPSRCGCLPAERSSLAYRVLVDVTTAQHEALLARGWRRFGCEWFRPVCPACTACRSLRIPLATFTPSRSQRRALRGNATVQVVMQAPTITGAHLRLYNAYHAAMHRQQGWPWHPIDPVEYFQSYLGGDWPFACRVCVTHTLLLPSARMEPFSPTTSQGEVKVHHAQPVRGKRPALVRAAQSRRVSTRTGSCRLVLC
jgi:hypothetical protein